MAPFGEYLPSGREAPLCCGTTVAGVTVAADIVVPAVAAQSAVLSTAACNGVVEVIRVNGDDRAHV
jgi:hypothetical protein